MSSLVTHTVSLEETGSAINSLREKDNNPLKIPVKVD